MTPATDSSMDPPVAPAAYAYGQSLWWGRPEPAVGG